MKHFIKRNWMYFLVSFLVLFIVVLGYLEDINFFHIMGRVISDEAHRLSFFKNLETESYHQIEPTYMNIIRYLLELSSSSAFDAAIILSTTWFQIIIPLFSIPVIVHFYQKYHSIYQSSLYRYKKTYLRFMIKEIFVHAFKLAISVFSAYFLFMLLISSRTSLTNLGAESRTLFNDLLGSGFYQNHVFAYFILEGLMRFFMMPFIYTCLGEATALLNLSLKYVIGSPLLYYYGLATIGYALKFLVPSIAPYINPTAFMANGDYELNTLLLLAVNLIPLYLSLGIVWYRSQHVEI